MHAALRENGGGGGGGGGGREHIKTQPKTASRTPRYHSLTSPAASESSFFVSGVNFGTEVHLLWTPLSVLVVYHHISSFEPTTTNVRVISNGPLEEEKKRNAYVIDLYVV
jgi:hypothetical protein